MSVILNLPSAASDVHDPGPEAKPEYGLGANFFYTGNKKTITPDVLVGMFQTHFDYANSYRLRFLPDILDSYMQYNAETQASGKEPWQADIHIPLPAQSVDIAAGRITEALFGDEDWFEVDPNRNKDTLLTEFAQKAVKWQFSKSRGIFDAKASIKDALICGFGPLKIHFEQVLEPYTDTEWVPGRVAMPGEVIPRTGSWQFKDAERIVKRMRFESIVPTDIWLDPTGKNRWLIQRSTRGVSDLWPLTEDLVDPDTGSVIRKAVYTKRYVARVSPGMRDPQRDIDAQRIRRDTATPYGVTYDQNVDVYEFWGDFTDPNTGVVLFKNCVITFVDKRICIRPPQRNPFRHGKPPFIIFQSKMLPHQVYGYGLLHQNRRILYQMNQHCNVLLDKAMLQVPTLEYDQSASKDPAVQAGSRPKFSPGKMWPRKPGPDKQIFYPVQGFQPIVPMDMVIIDRLTQWYQMASIVPEFETGTAMSTNRKTKGEIEMRMQAAQQNFNDAAVHIQEQGMGPLCRMVYMLMLQFEDQYDDDDLTRMFGDDQYAIQFITNLKSMSPAERWKECYLDSEFKAIGITNEQTRNRRLSQTSQFVSALSADPLLGMFIDKREQLRAMLPLFQQPKRMILDNADALLQMAQMAMIQGQFGQVMGQMGGGGQPPGQAGAPAGPGAPPQLNAGVPPKPAQGQNEHNTTAAVSAQAGRKP
jgi:hypothetical protein